MFSSWFQLGSHLFTHTSMWSFNKQRQHVFGSRAPSAGSTVNNMTTELLEKRSMTPTRGKRQPRDHSIINTFSKDLRKSKQLWVGLGFPDRYLSRLMTSSCGQLKRLLEVANTYLILRHKMVTYINGTDQLPLI